MESNLNLYLKEDKKEKKTTKIPLNTMMKIIFDLIKKEAEKNTD